MSPLISVDLANKTLTIDWSSLSDDQLYWISVANGVQNTPDLIPLLIAAGLKRQAIAAGAAFKQQTPDPRDTEASEISTLPS